MAGPYFDATAARFLLMSATLGGTDFFRDRSTALDGRRDGRGHLGDRPVPLTFTYREKPLHEAIHLLVNAGRAPVYVVSFTQRDAAEAAQSLDEHRFLYQRRKEGHRRNAGGRKLSTARMAKKCRSGCVMASGSTTLACSRATGCSSRSRAKRQTQDDLRDRYLGVGVNVPIRTVLFTKLCKYDGEKARILTVRDFHQIAGRAGRKGFDTEGFVVALAPEHVVENLRLEAKAARR